MESGGGVGWIDEFLHFGNGNNSEKKFWMKEVTGTWKLEPVTFIALSTDETEKTDLQGLLDG